MMPDHFGTAFRMRFGARVFAFGDMAAAALADCRSISSFARRKARKRSVRFRSAAASLSYSGAAFRLSTASASFFWKRDSARSRILVVTVDMQISSKQCCKSNQGDQHHGQAYSSTLEPMHQRHVQSPCR
jgi:hypothetical protein